MRCYPQEYDNWLHLGCPRVFCSFCLFGIIFLYFNYIYFYIFVCSIFRSSLLFLECKRIAFGAWYDVVISSAKVEAFFCRYYCLLSSRRIYMYNICWYHWAFQIQLFFEAYLCDCLEVVWVAWIIRKGVLPEEPTADMYLLVTYCLIPFFSTKLMYLFLPS